MKIDLRSDTLTKPGPEMLQAMVQAEVGDDVFGQDPSVNALEAYVADLFGRESAIFCASGTMTNQIAIKLHTDPMCEVIVEKTSHTYLYEGGGMAFNSACSIRPLDGDRGRLTAEQVQANVNKDDVHFAETRLVCLENTCNKGGGCYYDFNDFRRIREVCDAHGLKLHLDGARLFNALAETPETPRDYGAIFDTISICLSKGLGAPVGSLLIGDAAAIKQARRIRKVFGGGMRQAGFLAAAGRYALEHQVDRLVDDHRRAREVGEVLNTLDYVQRVRSIDTNIIVFELGSEAMVGAFLEYLESKNVYALTIGGPWVRLVTHLDFTEAMIPPLVDVLRKFTP